MDETICRSRDSADFGVDEESGEDAYRYFNIR